MPAPTFSPDRASTCSAGMPVSLDGGIIAPSPDPRQCATHWEGHPVLHPTSPRLRCATPHCREQRQGKTNGLRPTECWEVHSAGSPAPYRPATEGRRATWRTMVPASPHGDCSGLRTPLTSNSPRVQWLCGGPTSLEGSDTPSSLCSLAARPGMALREWERGCTHRALGHLTTSRTRP